MTIKMFCYQFEMFFYPAYRVFVLFAYSISFPFSVTERNVALHMPINQSEPAARGHVSLSVDGLFSTCTTFHTVTSPFYVLGGKQKQNKTHINLVKLFE